MPEATLLWLDAEHRLTRSVATLAARARAHAGVFSLRTAGTLRQWTHPLMLAYMYNSSAGTDAGRGVLGRVQPRLLRLDERRNCDASTVAFVRSEPAAAEVLGLWAACARIERCIAPAGSSRANHRQDQAALTLILQVTRHALLAVVAWLRARAGANTGAGAGTCVRWRAV